MKNDWYDYLGILIVGYLIISTSLFVLFIFLLPILGLIELILKGWS